MEDSVELREAASNGNFQKVKMLVKLGVDVNDGGKNNQTALHWAAQLGDVEICRFLIGQGAKVDAKNDHKVTPLMMAVSSNHIKLVDFFLEFKEININERNARGDTVLHIAAKRGHVELLQYLCHCGADISRRNNLGQLPEDIMPTSVEREISQWNNVLNDAIFGENIPISRTVPRLSPSSINGSNGSTTSESSEYHHAISDSGSIISLNSKTRIPSLRLADQTAQSEWSLVKAKMLPLADIPNPRDLTLISQIYLKYQNQRTDRLGRLLNRWRQHEELKIRLRRMIHDEIEDELKKCQIEHL